MGKINRIKWIVIVAVFGLLGTLTSAHASQHAANTVMAQTHPWLAFLHPAPGEPNQVVKSFTQKKIATMQDAPVLSDMGYLSFPEYYPLKYRLKQTHPHTEITSFHHIKNMNHPIYQGANKTFPDQIANMDDFKLDFNRYPTKSIRTKDRYDLVLGRNLLDARYNRRIDQSGGPILTPDPKRMFDIAHSMLKNKSSSAILQATPKMDIGILKDAIERFNLQPAKSRHPHQVQASLIEMPSERGVYVHIGTPEARKVIGWGQ